MEQDRPSIVFQYLGDSQEVAGEQAVERAEMAQSLRDSEDIAQMLAMIDEVNREERFYYTTA